MMIKNRFCLQTSIIYQGNLQWDTVGSAGRCRNHIAAVDSSYSPCSSFLVPAGSTASASSLSYLFLVLNSHLDASSGAFVFCVGVSFDKQQEWKGTPIRVCVLIHEITARQGENVIWKRSAKQSQCDSLKLWKGQIVSTWLPVIAQHPNSTTKKWEMLSSLQSLMSKGSFSTFSLPSNLRPTFPDSPFVAWIFRCPCWCWKCQTDRDVVLNFWQPACIKSIWGLGEAQCG